MIAGTIPSEDILWAISGAVRSLRDLNIQHSGRLGETDLVELAHVLLFIGSARADLRLLIFLPSPP